MLEKTEGASKIGQSRETGNVGDTRQQKAQHNVCRTPLYVNKHK